MKKFLVRFVREESGQGMAEYGLILALVAIAAIAALGILSGGIKDIFSGIGNKLTTEAGSIP